MSAGDDWHPGLGGIGHNILVMIQVKDFFFGLGNFYDQLTTD